MSAGRPKPMHNSIRSFPFATLVLLSAALVATACTTLSPAEQAERDRQASLPVAMASCEELQRRLDGIYIPNPLRNDHDNYADGRLSWREILADAIEDAYNSGVARQRAEAEATIHVIVAEQARRCGP